MEQVAEGFLEETPELAVPELLKVTNETVNANLHGNQLVPSEDSGTTAVSVLAIDATLYCSNVGDSRCVLGRKAPDGSVAPKPLSSDHTLYRADERERVVAAGGRVLSIGQIEGSVPLSHAWNCDLGAEIDQDGDPPRTRAGTGHVSTGPRARARARRPSRGHPPRFDRALRDDACFARPQAADLDGEEV